MCFSSPFPLFPLRLTVGRRGSRAGSGATACGVSRDEFAGACTTHTDLSPACVGVLADVLHASAKEDEAAAAAAAAGAAESKADGDGDDDDVAAPSSSTGRVLSVGNVVGMDWKLGMTVESSHCTDVSAPFVMLLLKVADSNGRVTSYPMELSLPEFRQLSTTLQETAAVVDSL